MNLKEFKVRIADLEKFLNDTLVQGDNQADECLDVYVNNNPVQHLMVKPSCQPDGKGRLIILSGNAGV